MQDPGGAPVRCQACGRVYEPHLGGWRPFQWACQACRRTYTESVAGCPHCTLSEGEMSRLLRRDYFRRWLVEHGRARAEDIR